MSAKLNDYDIRVLRTLNGEGDFIGEWGALVGVVLEFLQGSGLVTRGMHPQITDAGRAALAAGRRLDGVTHDAFPEVSP